MTVTGQIKGRQGSQSQQVIGIDTLKTFSAKKDNTLYVLRHF